MADTLTTTVGVGAATMVFTSLGLDPPPVFWALIGAAIGISFAPQTGKLRAAILFCATVLACSMLGSYVAVKFASGLPHERNVAACLLAIVFHPLLTTVVSSIPDLFKRFTNGRSQ